MSQTLYLEPCLMLVLLVHFINSPGIMWSCFMEVNNALRALTPFYIIRVPPLSQDVSALHSLCLLFHYSNSGRDNYPWGKADELGAQKSNAISGEVLGRNKCLSPRYKSSELLLSYCAAGIAQ